MTPVSTPGLPAILEQIVARKRVRVEAARTRVPEAELQRRAEGRRRRDFMQALRQVTPAPAVIAELKQASPSRGRLRADYAVERIAAGYEAAGAAALSVLTEEDFFLGELAHLERARAAVAVPVLRKDFLFEPYQVWEAAAVGADAVLLIAAMLDDERLTALLAVAAQAGLAALCEVHDADELRRVRAAGAQLIGVNNRDLRTFTVDATRALALAPSVPAGALSVAESGLRTPDDLRRMAAAGYQAVLVGEHLMQAADPGAALATLRQGLGADRGA